MSSPDAAEAIEKTRRLSLAFRGGKKGAGEAGEAFRELADYLLRLTILDSSAFVYGYRVSRDTYVVSGPTVEDELSVLRLRNGAYLNLFIQLFTDKKDRNYFKVSKSVAAYQLDPREDQRVVFRYEFIRGPKGKHPAAHMHVHGRLAEDGLLGADPLERVHFPTYRVPLEAVIRLLIDHFGIETATEEAIWRPCLLEAETAFHEIKHKPINRLAGKPQSGKGRKRRKK